MVYLGDGPTDVPCFTLMRLLRWQCHRRGTAWGRHPQGLPQMLAAQRARGSREAYRPADYRKGGHLRLMLRRK